MSSPSTASKVTTDHGEIRRWAEERGAKPAAAARTENDDGAAIIRLEFSGNGENQDSQGEIGWDEWFKKFERHGLAFLYQHETASGERSNYNEIIRRGVAEEVHEAVGGRGRSATHKRGAKSPKAASGSRPPAEGREATARRSTSARGHTSSSGRASTRSRSAEQRSSNAPHGGATRGSKSRSSRTPSRTGGEVPTD